MTPQEDLILDMKLFLAEHGTKKFLESVSESVKQYGEMIGGVQQWDAEETAENIKEEANRY